MNRDKLYPNLNLEEEDWRRSVLELIRELRENTYDKAKIDNNTFLKNTGDVCTGALEIKKTGAGHLKLSQLEPVIGSDPTLGFYHANNYGFRFRLDNAIADLHIDRNIAGSWTNDVITLDNSTGNTGIGTISPTAKLHLPAGTTSANNAPLKFTTQASPLTAVEEGTMEYVGHSLQFSQYLKRRGIVMSQDVRTATTTIENTTIESEALATVQHGANYLEVGKNEETVLIGTFSQRSNPSAFITIRVKYAGSTIHSFATPVSTGIAAEQFRLTITTTCRSIGATGTMQINSMFHIAGTTDDVGASSLPTIDTTSDEDLTITAQWGEADVSNILKIEQSRTTCIDTNK